MTLPSTLRPKNVIQNQNSSQIQTQPNLPSSLKPKQTNQEIRQEPEKEQEEGFWKSAFRTVSQPLQGFAATSTPGLLAGLWQALAHGEILDPEEIEHIKMISEREGIPFDEEKYMQAAQEALGAIPTVSNLARIAENKIGIPLEPKTRGQKALRFATEATRLAPEGASFRGMNVGLPKPVLGAGLTAIKEGAQELGVPEPLAELGSFLALKQPKAGSPSLKIGSETKPSGLTTRRYESLESPTKVSPKKISQINQAVENEFKNLTNDILEKSPIHETYSALKNDKSFKSDVIKGFEDIKTLASEIPDVIPTVSIKKKLADNIKNQKITGITPSEYESAKKHFMKKFIKNTKTKEATTSDLLDQYRKNNKSYGESLEMGKSNAYNRGKREALREYNNIIADEFESRFPESEFANSFKLRNQQYAEIMDAESIDKFMDKVFDGKINFKPGKRFLEKEGMQAPFKRALGEKGFKDFKQLTEDLMSTEKANKMLKVADKKGFHDLANKGLMYLISPKASYFKIGFEGVQDLYKKAWETVLDKPQLAVKWDKGIKAFKKGDFSTAQNEFNALTKKSRNLRNHPPNTKRTRYKYCYCYE